ncbi:hypothetical protein KSF78_0007180 [Schistosoma japonicum]|nr:hypothetical protein KSF78_0007180 [Schistosoma japonicum]
MQKCVRNENIWYKAKLNYLIQYCDGEAKFIIHHCTLLEPEAGYRKTLEILEEIFGLKHVVARKFIDKMLAIPSIRGNNSREFRKLSTGMQVCDLTLKRMDYISDLNSTKTIDSVVSKLPTRVQHEWVKIASKIIKGGGEPSFSDLTNFVKEQADIENTRYRLLVNETAMRRDNKDLVNPRTNVSTGRSKTGISYANISESDIMLPQVSMYLGLLY